MGKSKKSKNQIKVDKEKIKKLFKKQKVIQAQNKEILKDIELVSVNKLSKKLEKKIDQERIKKIKKQPKEIVVEKEQESGATTPTTNLFQMKNFQSSLILDDHPNLFQTPDLLQHFNFEEEQFNTINPFNKNDDFLEEDIQIEEEEVEERDEHLKNQEIKEDFVLQEINRLQDKFFKREEITHQMSKENPFYELRKSLPISEKEYEIQESIYQNLVVVVCGSTGSGKSTQIPQFLYEYGYDKLGKIGVTQPRRIAAISLAQRVEEEQQAKGQSLVGYQVRYEKSEQVDQNKIKFMTDGILLNEMMSDFLLKDYSIVIIDEAHERKLATDILIGLLSKVVEIRAQMALEQYRNCNTFDEIQIHPLRVVIMSATLRIDDFVNNQRLFTSSPPVVKIQAKTFPVNIYYNKITPEDPIEDMIRKVRKIHLNLPKGGILVFLTGKEEVNKFCKELHENMKYIKKCKMPDEEQILNGEIDPEKLDELVDEEPDFLNESGSIITDEFEQLEGSLVDLDNKKQMYYETETYIILPLYSKLPITQQQKIFEENDKRKIIITTNVAETSLTIDNLKYVIDSGKEKNKVINNVTGLVKYQIDDITKSSAKQRKGRVGRTNVGYCYRVYSPAVYKNFPEFKDPEIVYLPLDYVILQILKIGIKQPLSFPFPTQPQKQHLFQSYGQIKDLGLISEKDNEVTLTDLGEALSYIPMQPKISVMILRMRQSGMLQWGVILSGILNFEEIFINEKEFNKEKKVIKLNQLGQLVNNNSDLITQVNILVQFFNQRNKKFFYSQKILKSQKVLQEIRAFVNQYQINEKIFKEFLNFIFQNLLIFKNMLNPQEYQQLILNLTQAKKISKIEEKEVIKTVAMSFPKNICKKRTIFVEENKQKQRFETQDYREANFFPNSFVKKNETFYLYQTILEIDDKFYLHNITKITDYSLLYEIDLQRIGKNQIISEKRLQFNESFVTFYDKNQDKIYAHYRYYFGVFKWETPQFLFDSSMDQENRELLFLLSLLKGQIYIGLKPMIKMYSFQLDKLNDQMVKTNKAILSMINYFKNNQVFNKISLGEVINTKQFRENFLGLVSNHYKTQVGLRFSNTFSNQSQFIILNVFLRLFQFFLSFEVFEVLVVRLSIDDENKMKNSFFKRGFFSIKVIFRSFF